MVCDNRVQVQPRKLEDTKGNACSTKVSGFPILVPNGMYVCVQICVYMNVLKCNCKGNMNLGMNEVM